MPTNCLFPNACSQNDCCLNIYWPNVVQPIVCQRIVCQPNVFHPIVCQPNVCSPTVYCSDVSCQNVCSWNVSRPRGFWTKDSTPSLQLPNNDETKHFDVWMLVHSSQSMINNISNFFKTKFHILSTLLAVKLERLPIMGCWSTDKHLDTWIDKQTDRLMSSYADEPTSR